MPVPSLVTETGLKSANEYWDWKNALTVSRPSTCKKQKERRLPSGADDGSHPVQGIKPALAKFACADRLGNLAADARDDPGATAILRMSHLLGMLRQLPLVPSRQGQ